MRGGCNGTCLGQGTSSDVEDRQTSRNIGRAEQVMMVHVGMFPV